MGMELFYNMLNRDSGGLVRAEEDRLGSRQVASHTDESDPSERVLLVRLDGNYYIETVENAMMAATCDPDFVVAIPLTKLRILINRSVQ
jgi:ADP-ribosylglycohydrolase